MLRASILLCLLGGYGFSFAQNRAPIASSTPVALQGPAGTVDTISTYRDRLTDAVILHAGHDGYVLGSSQEFVETGNHYDGLGSTQVTELMVFFGTRQVMGNADQVQARFYAAGSDSMPSTLLGSGNASISNLQPSGFASYIPVSATGAATGDFFVSIYYGGIDDSISIVSSDPAGDGLLEKRTRQQNGFGVWRRSYDYWTIDGQPYNGDALILPIVDFTALGNAQAVGQHGLFLLPAYPQPSTGDLTLRFETSHAGNFTLRVYDAQGRNLYTEAQGHRAPGTHSIHLSGKGFAAGVYHYTLQGPKSTLAGKFEILR